jgi:DNA-binding CsgD family transcriptional regulator
MASRRIRGVRLTREERLEVRRLIGNGSSFEQAAVAARCSTKSIQRVLDSVGGMPPRGGVRAELRLSLAEREEISLGLGGEQSYRAIARSLGRAPSTISREVNSNGGRRRYRAVRADEAAYVKAGRPKLAKLRRSWRLRARVESMLNKLWFPQ